MEAPNKTTGSNFEGETVHGWPQGEGVYTYPDGVVYQGGFLNGEFDGRGSLFFPAGGEYRALWRRGRALDGEYIFKDALVWTRKDWKYLTLDDRRFYTEIKQGIRPAPDTATQN